MLKKLILVSGLALALTGCFGGDDYEHELKCTSDSDLIDITIIIGASDDEIKSVSISGEDSGEVDEELIDEAVKDGWDSEDEDTTMREYLQGFGIGFESTSGMSCKLD